MIEKEFKTYAPFGINTKRFAKIGFHPNLDVSGTYKKVSSNIGPFSYNPKYPGCHGKKDISWDRKLELEAFSKYLNYKNLKILHERQFQKTLGGPATRGPQPEVYKQKKASICQNVGFGTDRRFKCYETDDIPPPDTYHRDMQKLSTISPKSFSQLPTFERDGFIDRFQSTAPKHILAPNRYTLPIISGIDATLKKIVSLRGPYDLFTGPRDDSTIKNHFTPSITKVPDYYYINPSSLDVLLHHPSKSRTGKFFKCVRFTRKPCIRNMLRDLTLCYRDPKDPGPAHYNLVEFKSIKTDKKNQHPFNTSYPNARPPLKWTIFPGPGRYTTKQPRCLKTKRPSWVFLAKGDRSIIKPIEYSSF